MTNDQIMSDDYEIRRNLPSSTLEALEKEISEVLTTCQDFVDKDTKQRLKQLNNGNIFDYDTNTNIEKLAHDMTCILESFKEYLTNTPSQEDIRLKNKIKEIQDEKQIVKQKKKVEQKKVNPNKEEKVDKDKEKKEQILEENKTVVDKIPSESKNYIEVFEESSAEPKPNLKASPEKQNTPIKNTKISDKKVAGKELTSNKKVENPKTNTDKITYKIAAKTSLSAIDTKRKKSRSNLNKGLQIHSADKMKPKPNKQPSSSRPGSSKRRTSSKQRSKSKDSQKSVSQKSQSRPPTPKIEEKNSKFRQIPPLKPPVIPTIENTIRKSLNLSITKPYRPVQTRPSSEEPSEWSKRSGSSLSSKIGSAKPSSARVHGTESEKPSCLIVTSNTSNPGYPFVRSSSNSLYGGSLVSFGKGRGKVLNTGLPREIYNPLGVLKEEVDEAIAKRKTFTIRGCYPVIRYALIRRGWIEKVHASYRSSHIWRLVCAASISNGNENKIYNVFGGQYMSPSKGGSTTNTNKIVNREGDMKQYLSMTTQELLDMSRKPNTARMATLALKGKMLAYQQVDLFWGHNYDGYSECPDRNKLTMLNKIRWKNMYYTCKHGLCEASRQSFWFHVPGVSNLNVPRSYRLAKEGDAEEFVKDFNLTAAMSLLKWVKTRCEVQHNKLMTATGRIPLRMFDFAINECYKFLKRARHEDIDQEIKDALSHEWNEFLEYFYKIVHVGNLFKLEEHVSEVDMLRRANYILARLKEYWPYIDMDGELNIWILKPTNSCRGIGIHMCRTLKYVLDTVRANPNRRYIIQKYIERPLLIYKTKFDIRQWFLISSTVPITIWIYKVCYLRFSSQSYNLKKLHESIHLTNNSVQCKYRNANQDPHLPTFCMWDSNEFKTYLTGKGHSNVFNEIIYPGMKQCITAAVLMHQENMDKRRNSFEVYGADFLLTEDFKPWLLEINANPALHASTPVTAKLCPKLMEDVIKVVVDFERNKQASTGNFELIYKGMIKKDMQCKEEKSLVIDGKPLSPDYFYRSKWSPRDRDTETDWGMNRKIKNLSKNPDRTDFGLVSVTGMKQTLQSLLALLKKEKERRKDLKRRTLIAAPPYPSPLGVDIWLEKRKAASAQPVP